MKHLFIIFLFSIVSAKTVFSQVKSAEPEFLVDSSMLVWQYHSKVIGEDYTIYVTLPSGYDTSKTGRPVLYMTDGDWNMTVARDCFDMLEQDYYTTTPIIVGIGYGNRKNMRGRDFEPKTGGSKFLSFIETEVMPFIKKYHTSGDNTLFGYSYGGVFASYVLFEHPGLFNSILIGAPGNSGNELTSLTSSAQKYFETHTDLRCNVFAGVGSYEPEKSANVKNFGAYLKAQKIKSLTYKTVIIPGVAHGAGLAPVIQSAMKFAYCRTHSAITVPVTGLARYAGIYRSAEDPALKLRLFIRNRNLYFQVGKIKTLHFVPYAQDKFFMYEDEKTDINFKNDGNKQYFLLTTTGGKPQRIDKIN
ncbi:MAG: alpha/beta hydrolase-fold protein [Bacteroidota bacterium]